MPGASPVVWMNMTSSANWSRPPVGIIRVEQVFWNELKKLYPSSQFKACYWKDGAFRKLVQPIPQHFHGYSQAGDAIFRSGDVLISVGLDWDYPYYQKFYELRKKGVHIVTFCHDLIPVIYPQYTHRYVADKFASYLMEIADASSLILCNSKQTEHDLRTFLDGAGARIPQTMVVSFGDNIPEGSEAVSDQVEKLLQERYILYVSSIERRKNHEVLYRAYHRLCHDTEKHDQLPKLVFVGMPGWGVDELMNDINLDPLTHDLLVILNHVNDAELNRLYEQALFCVYPSLYEGWGLPIGEALSLGKVVLASDRGSIPEVGGDLALYLDPWNPAAWAEEIWRLSNDPAAIKKLEDQIHTSYQPRKWTQTAKSIQEKLANL